MKIIITTNINEFTMDSSADERPNFVRVDTGTVGFSIDTSNMTWDAVVNAARTRVQEVEEMRVDFYSPMLMSMPQMDDNVADDGTAGDFAPIEITDLDFHTALGHIITHACPDDDTGYSTDYCGPFIRILGTNRIWLLNENDFTQVVEWINNNGEVPEFIHGLEDLEDNCMFSIDMVVHTAGGEIEFSS